MTRLMDINARVTLVLSTPGASNPSGQEKISEDMGLLVYFSLGCLMPGLFLKGADAACCPMDWLPFEGHCYKLFTNKVTWADAAIACQNLHHGCHLASIHSLQEAVVVGKYLSKYHPDRTRIWIGLRDPQKNQQWRWIDHSPVNYLNWNQGEPNNVNNEEFCVNLEASSRFMQGYTKWNDLKCSHLLSYVCKFRL